jgi:hypothetical protein
MPSCSGLLTRAVCADCQSARRLSTVINLPHTLKLTHYLKGQYGIFFPDMRRPPDPQLLAFLEAYERPIADLALALREIILEEVPDASESIYQVYTVAIWFGFSGKMKDMFCYIATSARHINLGFPRGSTLPDPNGVLEGDGKAMRHIKFASQRDLERPFVRRYIRASIEQLGDAASKGGTGKSMVKNSGKKTSVKKRLVKRRRASR